MNNEKYISYLNSLHNYNAQNSNAYGEKNVNSEFFPKIAVKVGLCNFIEKYLKEKEPHVLILTGHAGDGKTSIMYQVLKDFGIDFNVSEKISDITLPNGKVCRCIKDYSELNDEEKLRILQVSIDFPKEDKFVFMVSNTGPLINTFSKLFEEKDKENAIIDLVEAIDDNSGEIRNIHGYKICVVNVAAVDNTSFAVSLLNNLVKDDLWEKCKNCDKCSYCHIYQNRNLILQNRQRVNEFLKHHYIWLVEHGIRLTVRSITEQLSYMLTGGLNCEQVCSLYKVKMLFFNLFFGYIGLKYNERANSIQAIRESKKCAYDKKRLRVDELLFVKCNYSELFGKEISEIIVEASKNDIFISGWQEFLRRAYSFTNIQTSSFETDCEDIFSKQFKRFIDIRDGKVSPSKIDTNLIIDALSMMYLGKLGNNSEDIPLTLNKDNGLSQNVQLVTGYIPTRRLMLTSKVTKDETFDDENKRYELILMVNGKPLKSHITLPMLNYFEDLRNGIIPTNIDPQLSHGVETLKAQLSKNLDESDNQTIEIIVLRNDENKHYNLVLSDDNEIELV